MSVQYKVIPKRQKAGTESTWHAVIVNAGTLNKRDLVHRIANRSVLGAPEVTAVIEALIELIPEIMLEGKILKIEGLGNFQLYASSEGANQAETFKKEMIKTPRLHFRPAQNLRNSLHLIKWQLKK
jgi:predicted histone-like DNA-binding protein